MSDLDRTVAAACASSGGRVIAGLVVAAIVFLALLLVFGEALFSRVGQGPATAQQSVTETIAR